MHNINTLNNLPPSQLPHSAVLSGRLIGRSGGSDVRPPCRREGALAGCELKLMTKDKNHPPLVVICCTFKKQETAPFPA